MMTKKSAQPIILDSSSDDEPKKKGPTPKKFIIDLCDSDTGTEEPRKTQPDEEHSDNSEFSLESVGEYSAHEDETVDENEESKIHQEGKEVAVEVVEDDRPSSEHLSAHSESLQEREPSEESPQKREGNGSIWDILRQNKRRKIQKDIPFDEFIPLSSEKDEILLNSHIQQKTKKTIFDEDEEGENREEAEEMADMFFKNIHPPEFIPPWRKSGDYIGKKPADVNFEMLKRELEDFIDWISPNEDERRAISLALLSLQEFSWTKLDAKLEAFGSFATNTNLCLSDVDLFIDSSCSLKKMFDQLGSCDAVETSQLISTAKVPIIKLKTKPFSIEIDISEEAQQNFSPSSTTSLVQKWMQNFPLLRPLVLFIKFLLYENSLEKTFTGGLGSYPLVLLAAAFLQMDEEANEDILSAVIRFLKFYGTEFDSTTQRMTLDGVEEKEDWDRDGQLEILDPTLDVLKPKITAKYIGSKSFRWRDVQSMFRDCYLVFYHKWFIHPTPLSRVIHHQQIIKIQERRQELKDIFEALSR